MKRDDSPAEPEGEIGRQIFQKLLNRIKNLNIDTPLADAELCPDLNPDIIVIADDQTLVFESQNERASTLLRQKCGWDTETINFRERVRVHPSQSQKFIEVLSAAGLTIAS
jgi:hypothetical protein